MNRLLMLYPRAWQRRYRKEVEAQLQSEPRDLRTALDLIAGAIDAWLNPHRIADVIKTKEEQPMISSSRCGSVDILPADRWQGGAWLIGASVGLVLIYFALRAVFGQHMMVQALLYAALPIAYTVSARSTYLKPYSRVARNGIVIVGVLTWYAFFLAMTALSTVI